MGALAEGTVPKGSEVVPPGDLSLWDRRGDSTEGRVGYWHWEIAENRFHCSNEVLAIFGIPVGLPVDSYTLFLEYIHPEDRPRWEEGMRRLARTPCDSKMEYRIVRPNRKIRAIRQTGVVCRSPLGTPLRMVGTVLDVTETTPKDQDIGVHLERMAGFERLVSIGTLASGVAHEINNPNQSILAFSGFLQEAWRSVQPILDRFYEDHGDFVVAGYDYSECRDRIHEALQGQIVSSKRIDVITRELRGFARRSPGDSMGVINVNAMVKSAAILVSHLARKSTDRFEVVYGRDLPPVRAHFQRIEQVFINLIQNACDALQDRDKGIRVSSAYNSESASVVVTVSDEGIGITDEHLEHITDPFFTTKWNSGGNGLGLWVSSEIVRRHGGRLEFSSVLGKGTTASVVLPAVTEACE